MGIETVQREQKARSATRPLAVCRKAPGTAAVGEPSRGRALGQNRGHEDATQVATLGHGLEGHLARLLILKLASGSDPDNSSDRTHPRALCQPA